MFSFIIDLSLFCVNSRFNLTLRECCDLVNMSHCGFQSRLGRTAVSRSKRRSCLPAAC
jgi:hypothetical protein